MFSDTAVRSGPSERQGITRRRIEITREVFRLQFTAGHCPGSRQLEDTQR